MCLPALVSVALLAAPATPARVGPDLAQLSRSLEELAERVAPSVVQVLTTGYSGRDGSGASLLSKERATGSRPTRPSTPATAAARWWTPRAAWWASTP